MGKTAGIIIIGDELLTGKVQDCNAFFMANELWSHGITLRRISIIPDSADEIAREVKKFSKEFDFVFTSGGIGPTHDDVTIEGISAAFNVKSVINSTLREILRERYENPTPEQLKMAEVPEGAELINDGTLTFPLISFKNIFIFPGIPEFLKKKFATILKLFNEPRILIKKVYLNEHESKIATILNEVVGRYKNVKIGSYPVIDNTEYAVKITLESLDKISLDSALRDLLDRLSEENLVRIED
ncbi:MAG: molybdopterin-binding protein [Nitrospirota bacterium]